MCFKKLFKNKSKQGRDEKILNCPRCNVGMKKLKKKDVIIDICKKCNGMWLDDGEIQRLNQISEEMNKNGKK